MTLAHVHTQVKHLVLVEILFGYCLKLSTVLFFKEIRGKDERCAFDLGVMLQNASCPYLFVAFSEMHAFDSQGCILFVAFCEVDASESCLQDRLKSFINML